MKCLRHGLLLALLAMLGGAFLSPLAAQVQSGAIFGKVSDPSGSVVPGALVTLEGPALVRPLAVVSSGSGAYRFPVVPAGTYSLRFEAPGFGKLVRESLRVETGFNAE